MAVKDGAGAAYSQVKQGYVTKQAERAAAADFRKKSPEEQKQAAKQADKERTKEEVEGEFVPKGEVLVGPKLPLILGCNRIGRWGMIENGDTTFSKMAKKVYGDAGLWKFIADANGYSEDKVKKGTCIYAPDIANTTYKIEDGNNYSQYSFANININYVKPVMQKSGNISLESHSSVVYVEYIFYGLKYTAPFLAKQVLTWDGYHEGHEKAKDYPKPMPGQQPIRIAQMQPSPSYKPTPTPNITKSNPMPTAEKGSVSPDGEFLKGILYRSNEVSAVIDSINVGYQNADISIKYDSKCRPLFKAVKGDFKTPRLKGEAFGKRFIRSGLKGTIVVTLLWAGAKAINDWDENRNLGHSALKFGVEAVKGGASAYAGIWASSVAFALVPGVGWAFLAAAGAGVVVSYGVAVLLDITETKIAGDW